MRVKKLLCVILLCISFCFVGCGEKNTLTSEQQECDHEWVDLGLSTSYMLADIYCPKCDLEKEVTEKEWRKIQIKQEYEKGLEKEGE